MIKYFFVIIFFLLTLLIQDAYSNNRPDFDWYWVFYENERKDNYQSYTIRPFFLQNIDNGNVFKASLMPLLFWEYIDAKKTEWKSLFGLIESVDYVHSNGIRDYDFGIFPLLLYGDSKDTRDKYLHIWPFGGTIKGKLGQDRITTVLFPGFLLFFVFPPVFPPTWINLGVFIASFIPVYVDYKSRDYKAYGILWPIIQRGKSPTRNDWRFLPFYAHNYKKDTYDNRSILMILNYQRVFMEGDEERTFFAFPFYGRRWNISSVRNSSTLFWPFFSWGYDFKRGDFELNFPWPLVQIETSVYPQISKRIFFPFFGIYKYNNNETFFITPLYFSIKKHTDTFDSEYYINALIIWYFKREYKNKPSPVYGTSWRYFKIWPLFQYEHDDRGNLAFNLLSLFPFRDPEGYEKLYQPFWTIFEYRRLDSGEKRLGLILRLYYQRWGEDFLNIKIPVIFSFGSSKNGISKLSFLDYCTLFCYNNDSSGEFISMLFSMFSYKNDGDGNYIRLFWIPIRFKKTPDNHIAVENNEMTDKEIEKDSNTEKEEMNYIRNSNLYLGNDINNTNDFILYTMRIF